MTPDSARISEAIIAWTGWGDSTWPSRDDERVIKQFGPDAAIDLLPAVHRLEDEFFASDARFFATDLKEMGDLAAERFRRIHPEISEDAVHALTWCYTYDYK
jgi:hypothetical protein